MLKLRVLLLTLFVFTVAATQPSTKIKIVQKPHYTVGYSEEFREPVWVEYEVLCTESKYSRKGLDFKPEPGLITTGNKDYADNEWDKGHMAPAADFDCDSLALIATFSYANCALQQENLNRGTWRFLEDHERKLAQQYPVMVRIDVDFSGPAKKVQSGARIPTGFWKTLHYAEHEEKYYFTNTKPKSSKFEDYLIEKK